MDSLIHSVPDHLKQDMTPAEEKLLRCVERGEVADLRSGNEAQDDPAAAESWGPDRTIRAAFMHWLCTSPEAAPRIHPRGIHVIGAKVSGALDFTGAALLHRLAITYSSFTDEIVLEDARTRTFILHGSHIPGLAADRVSVAGSLSLASVHCKGEVRLPVADIGGQLNCRGGRFDNSQGDALSADGATVKGGVFLAQGFQATGAVRLLGADIGGQLNCRGGRFDNSQGDALSAERTTVQGVAFLDKCRFEGVLNLMHARFAVIVDDAESWPAQGKLVLDGFQYERFGGAGASLNVRQRIAWLRRQHPEWFSLQPYDQLAAVLRQMGRENDVAEVMIAKQADRIAVARREARRMRDEQEARARELGCWSKIKVLLGCWSGYAIRVLSGWARQVFLGGIIGYGYRPWRALLWIAACILLGTVVFGWAEAQALMVPSQPAVLTSSRYVEAGVVPSDYPRFWAPAYAADAFLPIFNLHQEDFWLPDGGTWVGGLVRLYLWLHIGFGWILSTLFVAGVTGLVRRLE